MSMLSYSQRDSRWAHVKLGQSQATLGRFGCTVSCIADLTTYFKPSYTPPEVVSLSKFTSDGRIFWGSIRLNGIKFVRREYGRHNANILEALRNPDTAVILEVANHSHWVVATGWQKEIADFKIADPWLGDWSNMSRYGKNITGAAYFRRD